MYIPPILSLYIFIYVHAYVGEKKDVEVHLNENTN